MELWLERAWEARAQGGVCVSPSIRRCGPRALRGPAHHAALRGPVPPRLGRACVPAGPASTMDYSGAAAGKQGALGAWLRTSVGCPVWVSWWTQAPEFWSEQEGPPPASAHSSSPGGLGPPVCWAGPGLPLATPREGLVHSSLSHGRHLHSLSDHGGPRVSGRRRWPWQGPVAAVSPGRVPSRPCLVGPRVGGGMGGTGTTRCSACPMCYTLRPQTSVGALALGGHRSQCCPGHQPLSSWRDKTCPWH